MPHSVSRRRLLSTLAGAGVGLGAFAAAPASADPDQAKGLEQTNRILARALEQLQEVAAGWEEPPIPDLPAQTALLAAIELQASQIVVLAQTLAGRTR